MVVLFITQREIKGLALYTDVIAMHFLAPVADYFSKLKTIICMFISLSYFGFKYFSYLNEHIENLIKGVHLKGTVMEINEGAVNSEVIIDVGDGNTIVSSITNLYLI